MIVFHYFININSWCMKLDLTCLFVLDVGQHIIQFEFRKSKTCGVLREPKINGRFHLVEVHTCHKRIVSHFKMFFLTAHDLYLYKFRFILDHTHKHRCNHSHTKLSIKSQPLKITLLVFLQLL